MGTLRRRSRSEEDLSKPSNQMFEPSWRDQRRIRNLSFHRRSSFIPLLPNNRSMLTSDALSHFEVYRCGTVYNSKAQMDIHKKCCTSPRQRRTEFLSTLHIEKYETWRVEKMPWVKHTPTLRRRGQDEHAADRRRDASARPAGKSLRGRGSAPCQDDPDDRASTFRGRRQQPPGERPPAPSELGGVRKVKRIGPIQTAFCWQ